MVEFFKASPKGLLRVRGRKPAGSYAFEDVEVGSCFMVAHGTIQGGSLRNKASIVGKKLGKIFTVIDHGPQIGYEVARVK